MLSKRGVVICMAQVTIDLPDELERRLRKSAKKAKTSMSAHIATLTSRSLGTVRWPKGFADLFGSWEGEFPAIDDPPPEEVEGL